MSQPKFTVQQIEQQNQVFYTSLQQGKITQTQYNQAMATQRQNIVEAQNYEAIQSQPTIQDAPHEVELQVIKSQNTVFLNAVNSGQITPEQYNQAITIQNKNSESNYTEAVKDYNTKIQPSKDYWTAEGHPELGGVLTPNVVPQFMDVESYTINKQGEYEFKWKQESFRDMNAEVFGKTSYSQLTQQEIADLQSYYQQDANDWFSSLNGNKPANYKGPFGQKEFDILNKIRDVYDTGIVPMNTTKAVIRGAELGAMIAMPAFAPALGIGVTTGAILTSEALSIGLSQATKSIMPLISKDFQGGALTVDEILGAGAFGAILPPASGAVFKGITSVGQVGVKVVSNVAGRSGVNALIGGTTGIFSEDNPDTPENEKLNNILIGAGMGALMSAGTDLIATPAINALKVKFGLVTPLEKSLPTLGASGEEVNTFLSKPINKLGGKQVRLVGGVTENPVGTTQTLDEVVAQYTGKTVPTAHATLAPENFNLKAGGETLLKGFPSEGAGFRADKELYHFYSAPGSDDAINIYGGYMGIGSSESGSLSKPVFGGKPSVLVTKGTSISKEFLQGKGESAEAWLTRTSRLSGKTGIAQETLGGQSVERQFITPASYERQGELLPGSKFVSKGKVGTFQIKELPKGKLGEIPILKDMFAKTTNFDVFSGEYKPTGKAVKSSTSLDVIKYNKTQSPSSIRIPSPAKIAFASSLPVASILKPSLASLSSVKPMSSSSIIKPSKPMSMSDAISSFKPKTIPKSSPPSIIPSKSVYRNIPSLSSPRSSSQPSSIIKSLQKSPSYSPSNLSYNKIIPSTSKPKSSPTSNPYSSIIPNNSKPSSSKPNSNPYSSIILSASKSSSPYPSLYSPSPIPSSTKYYPMSNSNSKRIKEKDTGGSFVAYRATSVGGKQGIGKYESKARMIKFFPTRRKR